MIPFSKYFRLDNTDRCIDRWYCDDCEGIRKDGAKWKGRGVAIGGFKRHLLKYHPNKLKKIKVITYEYVE